MPIKVAGSELERAADTLYGRHLKGEWMAINQMQLALEGQPISADGARHYMALLAGARNWRDLLTSSPAVQAYAVALADNPSLSSHGVSFPAEPTYLETARKCLASRLELLGHFGTIARLAEFLAGNFETTKAATIPSQKIQWLLTSTGWPVMPIGALPLAAIMAGFKIQRYKTVSDPGCLMALSKASVTKTFGATAAEAYSNRLSE